MRKITSILFVILFAMISQAETLKVDFNGNNWGAVIEDTQAGFNAYNARNEVSADFVSRQYTAFGSAITVTPSWAQGVNERAMQSLWRENSNHYMEDDANMFHLVRDFIGTDTRNDGDGNKGLEDPMALTISGLAAGTYNWVSYHHDTAAANMGVFDVTVNDASGSSPMIYYDNQISGNGATTIDAVAKFTATLVSNGIDDVTLVFDQQPYSFEYNQAWFVMNGFEISDGVIENPWQSDAPLRRPISPEQPMWLVHVDTWNFADPQKIIELIPADIRPYVVFNISLSISHDEDGWSKVDSGYETAKSWLRTCAQNRMWAMIQPSSGGYSHFSDFDMTVYEEFYRDYPNFIGFNYCEQFWGYDSTTDLLSAAWTDRIAHFANLLALSHRYGGYLVVSWCGNQWAPRINPIGMLKRIPAFAAACRDYTENYILCEKYTTVSYKLNRESLCLGAYVSGYSGQYGIRYDSTGWRDANGDGDNFTLSTGGAAHLEHIMLTGETVIDGPELIWTQCFHGGGTVTLSDGYKERRWYTFSQFDNVSIDLFRKIVDGTVRIPSRQEVIDRTKVVVINDVHSGSNDDMYSSPETLFEGLYRMDGDGNYEDNLSFFKKTGRYPTIPTVYQLNDPNAQSFQVQINKSAYSTRWPDIAAKVNEFNRLFPSEYTGDIYAGRHENGWVVYNPYKTGQTASGSIPFKYNTCESMELTLSQYTSGIVREYPNKVTFYLSNYDDDLNLGMRTDTIKIFGSTSEPTYSWYDRADHQSSIVSKNWLDGMFTLTVQHNGPLDITVNCEGISTNRLTDYTPAVVAIPAKPLVYTGPGQYEGEFFDHKNIAGNVTDGDFTSPPPVTNYTGQGYLKFGTSSSASVRDYITVLKDGTYRLETRYSVTGADVNTIDLYVNGGYVATPTFSQTLTLSDWAVNTQDVSLKAGTNTIEFKAKATGASSVFFDNMVIVPTAYYGGGVIIQENRVGFAGVDGTIDTSYSGYTGDGYANTNDAIGSGIDWEVDFDTSITRSFTFMYACPDNRTADLIVDDHVIVSNIQFPSTGSWSDWDFVTVYARVEAGVSNVRLQSASFAGLPNIDYIEVTGIFDLEIPSVPTGLDATASVSTGQIDLSWNAPVGATSYDIKRSEIDGGPYTLIDSVKETSYRDIGLSELTTYYYVVSAVNSAGFSDESVQASAITADLAPAVPTDLVATAGGGRITLEWAENRETDLDSYNVYRSTASGSYGTPFATGITARTYIDNTAANDTVYYYVITAVDAANNESDYSDTATAMVTDGNIALLNATDFESGLGDWINLSTGEDNFDWMRKSGETSTPNTGPDGGANGSEYYVYLETSPSGAGRIAILESPVIRGYKRTLSFYYHMYGAEMGSLNVDIYDGVWHDAVWSLSNEQHAFESDDYTQAIVDLTNYAGPIQIRFRGVGVSGSCGDMAIDDIEVTGGLLYGDMNGDSRVNYSDLTEFIVYWMQEDCDLDLDDNCVISLYEFTEFARNWLDGSF